MSALKALTVHQHWAWAIGAGLKRWENRTWQTSYRGPLAIIAGQSRRSLFASRLLLESLGLAPPEEDELSFGAVVCLVDLVDCRRLASLSRSERLDPFAAGPFCWKLTNPRVLCRPLACRGVLGLMPLPAGAAAKIWRRARD